VFNVLYSAAPALSSLNPTANRAVAPLILAILTHYQTYIRRIPSFYLSNPPAQWVMTAAGKPTHSRKSSEFWLTIR